MQAERDLFLPPDSHVPLIKLRYSEPALKKFEARELIREYLEAAADYAYLDAANLDSLEFASFVNNAFDEDYLRLAPVDDLEDAQEHGATLAKLVVSIYKAWRDPNADKLHDVLDIAHKYDPDVAKALRHFQPESERAA